MLTGFATKPVLPFFFKPKPLPLRALYRTKDNRCSRGVCLCMRILLGAVLLVSCFLPLRFCGVSDPRRLPPRWSLGMPQAHCGAWLWIGSACFPRRAGVGSFLVRVGRRRPENLCMCALMCTFSFEKKLSCLTKDALFMDSNRCEVYTTWRLRVPLSMDASVVPFRSASTGSSLAEMGCYSCFFVLLVRSAFGLSIFSILSFPFSFQLFHHHHATEMVSANSLFWSRISRKGGE